MVLCWWSDTAESLKGVLACWNLTYLLGSLSLRGAVGNKGSVGLIPGLPIGDVVKSPRNVSSAARNEGNPG